jgi:hypothetical protein
MDPPHPIRFVADEDLDNRIIRGLLRRKSKLDIVRIQDASLSGENDASILAWASQEQRVLLTHDISTMTRFAFERIDSGNSIAGIIEIPQSLSIGAAIEDILIIEECCSAEEFENQILYLPL